MEIIKRVKTTSRWMRFMMAIVILVATYTVVGFLILPVVLKSVLAKQLSENLQREAVIQDIDLNPYALKLSVKGLTIKEREGSDTFVSFDELYLNAQTISAFKRAVVLRELRLEKPYFNIIRHEVNRFNFSDLAGAEKQQEKEEEKASAPIRFSLNNIQVINGAIDFWDGPKKKQHKIADLNIGVPFISSLPYNVHIFVQPLFAAKFNDTSISLEGQSKPFADSRETSIDVDLSDSNIPYYLAYVPMKLGFKMLDGHLDVKGTVTYIDKPEGESILSLAGDLHLRNLEFVDNEDRPLMKLPSVGVSIASAEPLAKKIHLSKVLFQSPEVSVRRGQGGNVNFQALFSEQETETETPETEVPETDVLDTEVAEEEGNETPFSITVDDMQIATGKVAFSDLAASEPFETTLEPVNVSILHFGNDEGERSAFDVSFQTEAKESLALKGEFSVEPLTAEGSLHLQGVPIGKYAPYYGETLAFTVEDGNLELQTQFLYHAGDANPELDLSGMSVDLASLNLKKVEDEEPFAQIPVLSIKETTLSLAGRELNTGEIHTEGGQLHCLRYKNGDLNLGTLVTRSEEPTETEESPVEEKPFHVTLNKVSVAGYAVRVVDKSIEPSYSTELTDIEGSVTGLSSQEAKPADVLLKGKLDKHAPLEIKGRINPLSKDLFLDLKVVFKNVELSPVSPYSGRYVGYTLEKGELSLDLEYLIDKKQIDSKNKFFIDQLTFGDAVESPDAVSLPVKLGVALLKNRDGEIDLDIPVSGSMDDPEFKVGKIILQTFMNLLVKAATSPFALLGAIVGGGEELSVVEFEYGRSNISPEAQKKLDTLTEALYERPSLDLDVEGHIDIEKDKEGLMAYLFDKKLRAQKLKRMTKKGSPVIPIDEVKIEPDEYEEYLKKAYKAETFKKPKNLIGLNKSLPAPEMEKLIRENMTVQDDDLKQLALERAKAVEAYLLQSEKIEPERIFLVKPKSLVPEKKGGLKDSRVNLSLK